MPAIRARVRHEHRLDDLQLRQVAAERLPAGVGPGEDAAARDGGGGRTALPAKECGQGGGQQDSQEDAAIQGAPAAAADSPRARSAATRKSRFIRAIVSRLMPFGHASLHSP